MATSSPSPARRAPAFRSAHVHAVFLRNVEAARHASHLWVLLSGLFEPVFYLGSVGFGVGALVGELTVGGHPVGYTEFVAPAMLTASLMNAAVSESTFTFFTKFRLMNLHDATACTPVSSAEIVCGETLWAVARGVVHTVSFLAFLYALGLLAPTRIPVLLLASLLVSAAFSAMGLALSLFLRGTHDFDRVNLVTFTMFVFSGTFVPTGDYPGVLAVLARCTPLAQAVDLIRALALGTAGPATAGHCAYLFALTAAGLLVAGRRVERSLHA
ncbi:ABC transporter [Streptomyces sp. Ru62]|uniref:ABC transporter permease n=1 Tax=Streptomyces sp. Ru62 TaxID=2080745 RepID=UPI000CDD58A5|nr:ABC transporter permease [Streptomyces sp. Ru62]POX63596.1 ABC transporter [Streptomyces sp. Ru62]